MDVSFPYSWTFHGAPHCKVWVLWGGSGRILRIPPWAGCCYPPSQPITHCGSVGQLCCHQMRCLHTRLGWQRGNQVQRGCGRAVWSVGVDELLWQRFSKPGLGKLLSQRGTACREPTMPTFTPKDRTAAWVQQDHGTHLHQETQLGSFDFGQALHFMGCVG